MSIYEKKDRWKIILTILAIGIIITTLWYTNRLASLVAEEEKKKAEQLAQAYTTLGTGADNQNVDFMFTFITANTTIPIIVVDSEGDMVFAGNLDSVKILEERYLKRQLRQMKTFADPIPLVIDEGVEQLLYYNHSRLYSMVRYYPIFQLLIIGGFLITAYIMFSTARRAEQNRVWVGMAKETAHQLGTPISSLVAWVEYLREEHGDKLGTITDEMAHDIGRLELITERFSKVGSAPDLHETDLGLALDNGATYIRKRASKKVSINFDRPDHAIPVSMSVPLFEWVIENLLKNALDAMNGTGKIDIKIVNEARQVHVDIIDSGKGIPKSRFNTVFEPGFSTKKRGWGLGLTLTKRIIENYHSGKIFVKNSTIGKGTTFRITLPKIN